MALFPLAGNGGYDAAHYALALSYDPATRWLGGHATITARATQDLSRLDFDLRGFVVSDVRVAGRPASFVGYSLETQTKPNFPYVPDEATLVHELAHMWYGDSVTLTQWPDIWLHEGFATWSEWIWSKHQGNKTAAQRFKQLYSTPAQALYAHHARLGPAEPLRRRHDHRVRGACGGCLRS